MRTTKLFVLGLALAAVGLPLLEGCSDPTTSATLVSVQVAPPTASIGIGVEQQFTATALYSDASSQDVTSTGQWASSDETVATVDNAGLATAVDAGTTDITVTFEGQTATATLTVTDVVVLSVVVSPPNATVAPGGTADFTAEAIYDDGTSDDVTDTATWASDDTGVATVADGTVTGVAAGITTVTATFRTVESAPVTVTVNAGHVLESIQVTPATTTANVGATQQYVALGTFRDGTVEDLTTTATWDSSDTAVATIDTDGLATAVAEGATTITASEVNTEGDTITSNDADLTVNAPALNSITIDPVTATIHAGTTPETVALTATGHYADGSTADLTTTATWASDDEAVATVSNAAGTEGVVTADDTSIGVVQITATQGGVTSGPAIINVVENATVTLVAVTPATTTVVAGEDVAFTAMATYGDGRTTNVTATATWTSATTTVASIDTTGLAHGIIPGTSVISATFGGQTGTATLTVTDATIVSIAITPAVATVAAGMTQAFTALATLTDGSTSDVTATATWTSSAVAIATVSGATATGVAVGTATITATAGTPPVSGTALLNVTNALPVSIAVTPTASTIPVAGTVALTAMATMTAGAPANVTALCAWTSAAPTVAAVSAAGVVTGVATGPATTITCTYGGLTGTAQVTVSGGTLSRIDITPPAPASLPVGLTQTFTATGVYTDGSTANLTTNANLTWTSSSAATATISNAAGSKGVATGVAVGGTNIGCYYDDGVASRVTAAPVALIVIAAVPTAISVTPATSTIPVAGTVALTAMATMTAGVPQNVTALCVWTSSTPATATVSGGVVTGVAASATAVTITCTYGGITGTAQVTVNGGILQRIDITPTAPASLPVGRTQAFTATGVYSDASTANLTTNANLTWTTSVVATATVSNAAGSKGVATGVAVGATNIGCYYDDGVAARITATPVALAVSAAVPVSIAVTTTTPSIPAGYTAQFVATATMSDGSTVPVTTTVTWSSAPVATATISNASGSQGLASGLVAGSATITATLGTLTATAPLTVTSATLVTISVTPAAPTVQQGLTQQFVATGNFSDGSTMVFTSLVTWAASGTGVTVSNTAGSNGLATVGASAATGPRTITATRGSIVGTATLTVVTARTLCSISVSVSPTVVPVGLTAQATAQGLYSSDGCATTAPEPVTDLVTWYTSAAAQATVSNAAGSKGLVTGVAAGTPNITAALGAVLSTPVAVTVTSCAFATVTVQADGGVTDIPRGTTRQYRAFGNYSGTSPCTYAAYDLTGLATWASDDVATATVSNAAGTKGLVTAATAPAAGSTTIRATYSTLPAGTQIATIQNACAQSITITPAAVSLPKGGVIRQFTASTRMSDGTDVDATTTASWARTAGTAADVNNTAPFKGLVTTGSTAGSATITATASSPCTGTVANTSVITVTDVTVTGVSVTPAAPSVVRGTTQQLTATATFSDSSTHDVTRAASWTSSVTAVANVDNTDNPPTSIKGLVRACGTAGCGGNTIVSAAFGSRTGASNVNVSGRNVTRVQVQLRSGFNCAAAFATVTTGYPVGIDIPLEAFITYSDTFTETVTATATWATSSSANVAVNAAGVANTIAGGSAVISATYGGVTSAVADRLTIGVGAQTTTSVAVSPPSGWTIGLGLSSQFTAVATFSGTGTPTCDISTTATWTTPATPAGRLTVSSSGMATATSNPANAGTATVRAARGTVVSIPDSVGTVSASCITRITVAPTTATINDGQNTTLRAYSVNAAGTATELIAPEVVTWAPTPASGVVNVVGTTSAVVTGTDPGTATVSATWDPGAARCPSVPTSNFTASSTVTVNAASLISITVTCPQDTWGGTTTGIPVGIYTNCTAGSLYSDGSSPDVTASATWTSDNVTVATVSDTTGTKGRVSGVATGAAAIRATIGTVSNFASLTVVGAILRPSNPIIVTPAGQSIPVGFSLQYSARGHYVLGGVPHDYDITELATWTSSNGAWATVSNASGTKGRASAVGVSTAPHVTVTAAYQTRTGTETLQVNNAILCSIDLTPAGTTTVGLGLTQQYAATGYYAVTCPGATYSRDITSAVTWGTSDPAIATITTGGLATARSVSVSGAIITATQGSVVSAATNILRVDDRCIMRIELTPATVNVPANVPVSFTATAVFSDATTANYTENVAMGITSSSGALVFPGGVGVSKGYSYSTAAGPATVTASYTGAVCSAGGTNSDTTAVTVNTATLSGITVAPATASVPVGLDTSYTATGSYSDSTSFNITATSSWSTAVGSTASVLAPGVVHGVAVGSTTVTATQGTRSGAGTVNVTAGVLDGIEIRGTVTLGDCLFTESASGIAHPVGGYFTWVRAYGHYTDGTSNVDITNSVTWTTDLPARASVSNVAGEQGKVTTGTTAGAVEITATSGSYHDHLALDVVNATLASVRINGGATAEAITLGNTSNLTLQGLFGLSDYYCMTESGTWTSGTPAVATVSNATGTKGRVSTVTTGASIVTAAVGTRTDTITVNVGSAALSWIEVLPATLTLSVGSTAQFHAIGHYTDLTTNDITINATTSWYSSAAAVAVVGSPKGLMRAAATGSARINACVPDDTTAGHICADDHVPDARATVTVP